EVAVGLGEERPPVADARDGRGEGVALRSDLEKVPLAGTRRGAGGARPAALGRGENAFELLLAERPADGGGVGRGDAGRRAAAIIRGVPSRGGRGEEDVRVGVVEEPRLEP